MESAVRIFITIFFIALIALGVIFFGMFGLIPLGQKVNKEKQAEFVLVEGEREQRNVPPRREVEVSQGTAGFGPVENIVEYPAAPGEESFPPAENGRQPEERPILPPPEPVKKEIRLDVPPGSANAPEQSSPISESQIPAGAIKIKVQNGVMTPAEFSIKKGQEVTLAFSSADSRTHILAFKEKSVSAISIGVGPGETRMMTFNAPPPGAYNYFCNVPGHGTETGVMTVTD